MHGHLGEELPSHVRECPDCQARLDVYQRLVGQLGRESERPLPDGWKRRTLARVRAKQVRRKIAIAGVAMAAAAAAIILVLVTRDPPPRREAAPRLHAELMMRIEPGPITRRSSQQARSGHPGDTLHVSFPATTARHVELRIYREGREMAVRCPGDAAPTCRRGDAIEIAWQLPSPGDYQVVILESPSPLPEPGGDRDTDIRAARKAGARATESEPIHVD